MPQIPLQIVKYKGWIRPTIFSQVFHFVFRYHKTCVTQIFTLPEIHIQKNDTNSWTIILLKVFLLFVVTIPEVHSPRAICKHCILGHLGLPHLKNAVFQLLAWLPSQDLSMQKMVQYCEHYCSKMIILRLRKPDSEMPRTVILICLINLFVWLR